MSYAKYLGRVKARMVSDHDKGYSVYTCNCSQWTVRDGSELGYHKRLTGAIKKVMGPNGTYHSVLCDLYKGEPNPQAVWYFQLYMMRRMIGEAKLDN